jgi:hypothetical protein
VELKDGFAAVPLTKLMHGSQYAMLYSVKYEEDGVEEDLSAEYVRRHAVQEVGRGARRKAKEACGGREGSSGQSKSRKRSSNKSNGTKARKRNGGSSQHGKTSWESSELGSPSSKKEEAALLKYAIECSMKEQ